MPEMDGFAVMESLKTSTTDSYLPVIVITAQPGHKLRALRAGAKDFISKPFDLVEVKTRIYNMLEVRLLYKKLASYNQELEAQVAERTAELLESEARYRSLAELACDWYWEQDESGQFTKVSGPVLDMLGLQVSPLLADKELSLPSGWNDEERGRLHETITNRRPFLDFVLHRQNPDGQQQTFQVSGEPMFDRLSRFVGYRGVGLELTRKS